jgi:hypothetical protein
MDYIAKFKDPDGVDTTFPLSECTSVKDARQEVRNVFKLEDHPKIKISVTKQKPKK